MLMYRAVDGNLSRVPEIARAYGVSKLFQFKILQPLAGHQLVETVRGRNGGVRLKRAAKDISLFDVIRVTEVNLAMTECFEDEAIECPLVDSCGLNLALREYSIPDLLSHGRMFVRCLGLMKILRENASPADKLMI